MRAARRRGARRVLAPHGRGLRRLRRAVPARGRGRFRRAAAALLRAARAQRDRCASTTAQRFRHILVDEFQDTNRLQYRWLKLLAGPTNAIFAVGDDDQSIYAFRGANVGNMADFERDFTIEQRDQARAELPLARQHPRRRQRADRPQPQAPRQEPVDLRGQGRAAAGLRGASRHRGGALHRRGGEGAARARACALVADRRCSTARTRSRACSSTRCSPPASPTASTAGCASSSAQEIKHALAYLRLVANARRRQRLPARRQLPDARHRRAHASSSCRTRRASAASSLWPPRARYASARPRGRS